MDNSDKLKIIIGNTLKKNREDCQVSKYKINKIGELRLEVINKIESGGRYTMESLLKYLFPQDIYIFFGDKHGNIINPSMYEDSETVISEIND